MADARRGGQPEASTRAIAAFNAVSMRPTASIGLSRLLGMSISIVNLICQL
jgi:hypothetical protein